MGLVWCIIVCVSISVDWPGVDVTASAPASEASMRTTPDVVSDVEGFKKADDVDEDDDDDFGSNGRRDGVAEAVSCTISCSS